MTERPDNARLHDWLDDTVGQTPDPAEGTRQVMSQVEETSQVGRWLPFPVLNRKSKAKTPTATHTTDYEPSPIPASNGHTPTVIGRTSSMLSPAKAITAGALVFAIGGVMLVAQPFQQAASAPGAESQAVAPTWVTGTVERAPSCTGGTAVPGDGAIHVRDVECSSQPWTSSDPRLTGEVSRLWNDDSYLTDEGPVPITVSRDLAYLRNDDGGWACSATDLVKGLGSETEEMTATTYTCIGEGGYDGLSALLVSEQGPNYSEDFVGLVFSGDLPPLPESPAAE